MATERNATVFERRRKFSKEEKAAIVSETLGSNASVADVARKYNVHPHCLYQWKSRLHSASRKSATPFTRPETRALSTKSKSQQKPLNKTPARQLAEIVAAPKIFAVEAVPQTPVSDSVQLIVGDLVLTISTGGGS